ncbi:MAG: hypothetical protein ABR600_13190 [Actinomycetota bacterium]
MRGPIAVAAAAALATLWLAPVPAHAAVPAGCTITGTAGDDALMGADGDDVICGLGGDDSLTGGGGNDVVFGGDGDDIMRGGDGDDRLQGGPGDDTVSFEFSAAPITASLRLGTASGNGEDTLSFVEALVGSPLDDSLEGSSGEDELHGGAGGDVVSGLGAADLLFGEAGDDRISGGLDDDVVDAGWGADRIDGGYGRDRLLGGEGSDTLDGGTGPDVVEGQDGADRLLGGTGTDGCVQGLDHGTKRGCEIVSYADASGVALFVPSRSPVGFGYHESLFGSAIDLRPYGHLVENGNSGKFSPPPETEDGPDYVVMGSRGRGPGATTATDIVVPSGSQVFGPLDATVVSVDRYLLYCQTRDWKVVLRPDEAPTDRVLVLHMATPLVQPGDDVIAGVTVLGIAASNDGSNAQENRYFPDQYPHVHIEVERAGASPTPGCELP